MTDLDALKDFSQDILKDPKQSEVLNVEIVRDEIVIAVAKEKIVELIQQLREAPHHSFETLIDITCVDYPSRLERFELVYHLLSMKMNFRLRVKVRTDSDTAVPSITEVFPCANWYEREVFDMFGIVFEGHPDLRRLLTDYGFDGYPLRKDFPLTGHNEVRYDPSQRRVVYEPVKLTQEYRDFDFESPWEGMLQEKSTTSVSDTESSQDG